MGGGRDGIRKKPVSQTCSPEQFPKMKKRPSSQPLSPCFRPHCPRQRPPFEHSPPSWDLHRRCLGPPRALAGGCRARPLLHASPKNRRVKPTLVYRSNAGLKGGDAQSRGGQKGRKEGGGRVPWSASFDLVIASHARQMRREGRLSPLAPPRLHAILSPWQPLSAGLRPGNSPQ